MAEASQLNQLPLDNTESLGAQSLANLLHVSRIPSLTHCREDGRKKANKMESNINIPITNRSPHPVTPGTKPP
jgi:hypothetical protein